MKQSSIIIICHLVISKSVIRAVTIFAIRNAAAAVDDDDDDMMMMRL